MAELSVTEPQLKVDGNSGRSQYNAHEAVSVERHRFGQVALIDQRDAGR